MGRLTAWIGVVLMVALFSGAAASQIDTQPFAAQDSLQVRALSSSVHVHVGAGRLCAAHAPPCGLTIWRCAPPCRPPQLASASAHSRTLPTPPRGTASCSRWAPSAHAPGSSAQCALRSSCGRTPRATRATDSHNHGRAPQRLACWMFRSTSLLSLVPGRARSCPSCRRPRSSWMACCKRQSWTQSAQTSPRAAAAWW